MMMQNPCVTIDDPMNPHNNVGKSSFKFFEIKVIYNTQVNPTFRWLLTILKEYFSLVVSVIAITITIGEVVKQAKNLRQFFKLSGKPKK